MAKKKSARKKRPHYGRIIVSLALIGVIIFFLAKLGLDLFYKEQNSYLVPYGDLDLKDQYQAIVFRNEMVVKTNTSGDISFLAEEERIVAKGEPVVELYNNGNVTNASKPNVESGDTPQATQSNLEYNYNVLEFDIMNLKDQIIFNIKNQTYQEIPALKRDLLLKLEMREKLEGENKFLANRTTSYTQKTVGTGTLKEGQSLVVTAPASGMLTYQLDGYEDVFTIDNIYNINYDEIDTLNIASKRVSSDHVNSGDPVFKIVDHATGYLVVLIDKEEVETYKNVSKVKVKINTEEIEGQVYDVFVSTDNAIAVIRVSEAFDQYFDQRVVGCEITRQNYQGLKLHTDSLLSYNNQNGVYVVEMDRTLRFVPVKVIGYDEDYAVVYNEQFYDATLGLVRSIKANQEVVREGAKYKEGDRIN
ncbi:HlyD family efflux transporter periplasmic adaptor subunit [Fusibacter sp. 3D3]|uniref:HlyD family efflux transporter periplasmic adaptor subunit n=1 Tax=Fusibacter sp. 3D3 TaxID=1048380 RepID=UPI0008539FCF|nr:HlyD family efflux transporter periplasmic adaptor subunit [Fusibacter sp. 3D3]GAU78709.1 membrane-fusion protein [Fusibacter sp. 3D3]